MPSIAIKRARSATGSERKQSKKMRNGTKQQDTNRDDGSPKNVNVSSKISMMDVNTLHFDRVIQDWVDSSSFIHLDFRLELPAPRKSLSRLAERFLRSRLFDLSLCFRLDLSRSFARLRRTGEVDLLLLLERPIC